MPVLPVAGQGVTPSHVFAAPVRRSYIAGRLKGTPGGLGADIITQVRAAIAELRCLLMLQLQDADHVHAS
jgi:hypothetical protein